ncbi:MAG: RNA polymerase sigma factor RpoD/SigA [Pedobacter sp.]|nr:MAG: RNA polymerase sigma factor RpoD/SigA [Pedobacter sp.]
MRELKISKSYTNREDESMGRYLNDISQIDMITGKDEVMLAQKIKMGDTAAEHKLVTANLRFVVSCAKKYQGKGLPLSDLINEGNVGLIKAAKLFDQTRGFKFISYAVWWIRQSILAALNQYARMIRLPMNQQLGMTEIIGATQKLEQNLEREPTLGELAEYLERNENKLADFICCNVKINYLDDHIPGGDTEDNTLLNYLPDGDGNGTERWIGEEQLHFNIDKLLHNLTPREKRIIILSFGLYGQQPLDYEDIAREINLSRERTRQIRTEAIKKMRKLNKADFLQEYA